MEEAGEGIDMKDSSPFLAKTDSNKSNKESSTHLHKVITSSSSMVCRICQTNSSHEPLISPCHCRGSMAYVHLSCLERWLNQSSRCYCELCMFQFNAVKTKRYRLFEGIKLWIRHPRNRSHVQSDVLIGLLLTIITIGLVVVCMMGMQYFVIEAKKLGVNKIWTQAMLGAFLGIVVCGYVVTVYLLVKDQLIPWYHWWQQTVDVRLLLTPSILRGSAKEHLRETSV